LPLGASGQTAPVGSDGFFGSAGTLRSTYEAVDWSRSPVGPPERWSPTLLGAVDLMLNTRFPVTLLWGPQFALLYNEAFVPLIGDKHPAALGQPAQEVFPEAWDLIGPMMQSVLAGDGPTWFEDEHVPLKRRGFLEDCWFTYSYSPVRAPDGTIEGVIDIAAETTRDVMSRRRVRLLALLGQGLGEVQSVEEVIAFGLRALAEEREDIVAVDVPVLRDAPPDDGELHLERTPQGPVARMTLGAAPDGDGALVFVGRLSERQALTDLLVAFVRVVASALRQAIRRVRIREAERAVADAQRGISEVLQRSLLTTPLQPNHLQIAVRYWPATLDAQVGGDWYDSFLRPDGALMLVIGDVAGHDRQAVAAMAQMRNLLRGVAHTLEGPPAAVLTKLDEAMHTLGLDVFATAVVAQVEQTDLQAGADVRTLRWSSAGHPPPVLVTPDGDARLLGAPSDVALGLRAGERRDHTAVLEPGASVVFYTDGLVERRGESLDDGLTRLLATLRGEPELDAEALCERLTALHGEQREDDVALLVLTAHPEG
jgi:serine phosphatase RsbU (regulator of sigma subunit)